MFKKWHGIASFSLQMLISSSDARVEEQNKMLLPVSNLILMIPVSRGMVLRLSKAIIKTAALPFLLQLPNCLDSSFLQLFGEFLRFELQGCGLEADYPNCNICKILISATAGVNFSLDDCPAVVLVTSSLVNKLFVSCLSHVSFPS